MKFIKKIIREFFRLINQLLSLARSDYVIIKKQDPNQNSLIKNVENEYNDYWIIMPLSAFGDSLVVFKLIKEFKKNRGGKVVVISNQERILKLARMFPDIDETKLVSSEFYENKLNTVSKIKLGKVFSCHFYFREFLFNKISKNMLARSRDFLGIKDDIYGESPVISAESIIEANKIINNYKLENQKIVLISPFSVSMNANSLSKNFWLNMARTLEKKGYKVVFNRNILPENNNQEFINIFSDIDVISAFASICDSIIGMRSGLLDVLRDSTNTRILSIYNYNHNHNTSELPGEFYFDDEKSSIENYIECCSLKTMYKNNNTVELIYDGNENILEQQIIKNF